MLFAVRKTSIIPYLRRPFFFIKVSLSFRCFVQGGGHREAVQPAHIVQLLPTKGKLLAQLFVQFQAMHRKYAPNCHGLQILVVQAAQHAGGFLLAAHRRVEIDHKLLGIVALVAQHKGDHGAVVFHCALVKAGAVLIVVVTDIHIHVQLGPVLFAAGQNAQHAFAHVHAAAVELIQINGIRRGKRPARCNW